MYADGYFVECIIRDRLAEAEARVRLGTLRREAKPRSRATTGIGHQLIGLVRSLVRTCLSARPGRTTTAVPCATHSPILALDMYEHSYRLDRGASADSECGGPFDDHPGVISAMTEFADLESAGHVGSRRRSDPPF